MKRVSDERCMRTPTTVRTWSNCKRYRLRKMPRQTVVTRHKRNGRHTSCGYYSNATAAVAAYMRHILIYQHSDRLAHKLILREC